MRILLTFRLLAVSVALLAACAAPLQAMDITDMAGRAVTIPDASTKVFCSTPPTLLLLYALDPSLAAGLNFAFTGRETTYLRPEFLNLPVLGGWFGQGQTPNLESVMAANPDFILTWSWRTSAVEEVVAKTAKTINLPVVYVRLDSLEDYAQAFEFLGRILHREARGQALALAARRMVAEVESVVAAIPKKERVSVYYAQGMDGLKTECDTSVHAELINLAGGRNVRSCKARDAYGMESVGIEEVLCADPDVILAKERPFAQAARTSPVWNHLRAVRDGKVFSIPTTPFNWFDRPPSFMRILGLCWLTNKLYPERYPKDMIAEAKAFYRLFLNVDLDDAQARAVLEP